MQTITGILKDTAGAPVHCRVTVESLSTPLFGAGGIITGNTTISKLTDPDDGSFEFELKPGTYQVTYATTPKQTTFRIVVEADSGSAEIDDLVETEEAAIPDNATSITLIDQGTLLPVTLRIQDGEIRIV